MALQHAAETGSHVKLGRALCECARHVEAESMEAATRCLARATSLAAAAGDGPPRRLAVPLTDCLARRILRPLPAIADALIDPSDHLDRRCVRAARRSFFDLCPFPKIAFVVANRAVLEAMDKEQNVHVIDFAGPAAQPCQWIQLLRDFHGRPEGAPHLRLTVVHDDRDFLRNTSECLSEEAEELNMAFQFHGVVGQLETLDPDDLHGALRLRSGEARAICCTLQLHRLLADDADDATGAGRSSGSTEQLQRMVSASTTPRLPRGGGEDDDDDDDEPFSSPATPLSFVSPPATTPRLHTPPALARFLAAARALAPSIVVVTEQDAGHGGVSFRKRFAEALGYYGALYGSLDAAASAYRRPAAERAEVERAVLGEEIRGVLLREGASRRERHDRLQQWALRMGAAGFRAVPLSYIALWRGEDMRRRCGLEGCEGRELAGCLLLGWKSWPLFSVSAWRPERGWGSAYGSTEYLSVASERDDDPAAAEL